MMRKLKVNLAISSSMSIIFTSMMYLVFLESTGYNQSILFQLIGSSVFILTSFFMCYFINKYKTFLEDVYGDDKCLYIYIAIFLTGCFLFFYQMSKVSVLEDINNRSMFSYLLNVLVVIPPMYYSYKYTKDSYKLVLDTKPEYKLNIISIMFITVTVALTSIWTQILVTLHGIPVFVIEVVTIVNSIIFKGVLSVSIICCALVLRSISKDLRKHGKSTCICILEVILYILYGVFLLLGMYKFYIYYL